jgi:hypothetical protein
MVKTRGRCFLSPEVSDGEPPRRTVQARVDEKPGLRTMCSFASSSGRSALCRPPFSSWRRSRGGCGRGLERDPGATAEALPCARPAVASRRPGLAPNRARSANRQGPQARRAGAAGRPRAPARGRRPRRRRPCTLPAYPQYIAIPKRIVDLFATTQFRHLRRRRKHRRA